MNLTDAKTHLSRYLNSVGKGETIVICRRNVPIAEIRPIPKPPMKMRLVGIDSGMTIPPVSSMRFLMICSTHSRVATGRREAPA